MVLYRLINNFFRLIYKCYFPIYDCMHVFDQGAKLEKRTDMYISTLRSHIKALGGELEVIAHFPDGDVRKSKFSQI
jgi:hypothetical protein